MIPHVKLGSAESSGHHGVIPENALGHHGVIRPDFRLRISSRKRFERHGVTPPAQHDVISQAFWVIPSGVGGVTVEGFWESRR